MARTQAADYDQKRKLIVEEATRLFARFGFRGASVSDLAQACDTSKSLMYHYYPSKEDILYAVMASHIDEIVEDAAAAAAQDGRPREKLGRMVHAFMRRYVGAANRQKILLNEIDNLPPDKRKIIVDKQRQIIAEVQSLLEQIDPELARDKTRARVKTMLLFGTINWTHTWFDPTGPISPDVLAEMALELVLP